MLLFFIKSKTAMPHLVISAPMQCLFDDGPLGIQGSLDSCPAFCGELGYIT